MKNYAALSGRIQQQRADLQLVVERAAALLEKAKRSGDDGYLDGAALNLHGFYTGIESILEDIARTVDGGVPQGADWHKRLLLQMSAEIQEIRIPVIRQETRHCLEEYRAFRHVVRNVYTFNFRFSRIEELVSGVQSCFETVFEDLSHFSLFLKKIDTDE